MVLTGVDKTSNVAKIRDLVARPKDSWVFYRSLLTIGKVGGFVVLQVLAHRPISTDI